MTAQPEGRRPTILHGPYGDEWAWSLDMGPLGMGWHHAETEEKALEAARAQIQKWSRDPAEAIVDRVDVPVQPPRRGGMHDTDGQYTEHKNGEATGTSIDFGGAVPVQGDGEVDGYEAYYRARGSGWSLTVTLSENETWTYAENDYAWPDGGWIHHEVSEENIERAIAAFRARLGETP